MKFYIVNGENDFTCESESPLNAAVKSLEAWMAKCRVIDITSDLKRYFYVDERGLRGKGKAKHKLHRDVVIAKMEGDALLGIPV